MQTLTVDYPRMGNTLHRPWCLHKSGWLSVRKKGCICSLFCV